jgi:excisionase family DNA binding protein
MRTETSGAPEWLSAQQAADFISVSKEYIYDACRVGGLRHTRLGGKRNIRLRRDWITDWMTEHSNVNLFQ